MHKRKGALLDIKKNKLKAILASMAIPGYQMPVKIGEGYFIDGGWCPLPMSEIILRFRLTDVLIVANRPTAREESTFEYMLDWYTGADTSLDTALERMQKLKRTRVLAILPTQETAIPRLLADAKTIRKSTAVAARFMEDILDEAYVA
jgi:predicted acylesterase/phospholipase RssA